MSKIIVLDPGHGGNTKIGGSSPNNAISSSGVLEKVMTLDMAKRIRAVLATAPGVEVIMTRATDVNIGISARAQIAASNHADLFLSIHFNATAGARGVETWIRGTGRGNINFTADKAFAQRIQKAVVASIRSHDSATPDRGVKSDDDRDEGIGVLNDVSLGNSSGTSHLCRACLAEIEFIDHPTVDRLFNTGSNVEAVRNDVASAIAEALLAELGVAFSPGAILAGAVGGGVAPNGGVAAPILAGDGVVPPPEIPKLTSRLFSSNAALEAVADNTIRLTDSSQKREEVGLVQDALLLLAGLGGNYQVDLGSSRQFRGFYGPKTKTAVEAFENDFRLTINGIVDSETILALDAAVAKAEHGFNPLPVVVLPKPGAGGYAPPAASAAVLSDLDFNNATPDMGKKYRSAYAAADADPHKAKGDPSNCKALLQFPRAVFFEAKMAICADGSPRSNGDHPGSIDRPFGQLETAKKNPVDNSNFDAEKVPYIVLPGKGGPGNFVTDFGIKDRDLAVVICKGQITPAFFGEVGPAFRLGEAAIQVHENLVPAVKFPWQTSEKKSIRNSSVEGGVIYIVFPGTAVAKTAGMSPNDWLEATLQAAKDRFAAFLASGGKA